MRVLLTGIAGFIGFHLARRLATEGVEVVGVDDLNDYYAVSLKIARLGQLGFSAEAVAQGERQRSVLYEGLEFLRGDIADQALMQRLIAESGVDVVVNLAAQAGVRYSLECPEAYTHSNIDGFVSLLEACRRAGVRRIVYASSSSVYGSNSKVPFSEDDAVEQPESLYAVTKRTNELLASCYGRLYGLRCVGLRFFTVYGEWGRPDMAPMLFADAITQSKPIKVFGEGELWRDFTYIDDVVEGVWRVVAAEGEAPHSLYNIGCSQPIKLTDFIATMEQALGCEARKEYLPCQAGDVERTWADCSRLEHDFGYHPTTPLAEGIARFVEWYRGYYEV